MLRILWSWITHNRTESSYEAEACVYKHAIGDDELAWAIRRLGRLADYGVRPEEVIQAFTEKIPHLGIYVNNDEESEAE